MKCSECLYVERDILRKRVAHLEEMLTITGLRGSCAICTAPSEDKNFLGYCADCACQ